MEDEVVSVYLLLPPVSTAVEGLQNLGALSDKVLSAYLCTPWYTVTYSSSPCPNPLYSCSTNSVTLNYNSTYVQSILLLHTLAYSCTLLDTFAYSCTLLHTLAHCWILLHTLAHSCIFLHTLAHSCTLQEDLTPMGKVLAELPIEPRVGRLILLGAILGTLDPALTIAASMGYKDPFLSPPTKRREADEVRSSVCLSVVVL